MSASAQVTLEPGRVYRTRDLYAWGRNPSRLARRLVEQNELVQLAQGLYLHPEKSSLGDVPADDRELVRVFLGDDEFVFTGSEQWNALGLGSTAVFTKPIIYNHKRSGEFRLGTRKFVFRRVSYPSQPTPEWFVVDLFEHADMAGVSREELAEGLVAAVHAKKLDVTRLREMAARYSTAKNRSIIESAVKMALP